MAAYKVGSTGRVWEHNGNMLDFRGRSLSLEDYKQLPQKKGESALVAFGYRDWDKDVYHQVPVKLTRI